MIPAQIGDDLQVVDLPLNCLRSPHKDFIDVSGPRGADWGLTYRAAQRGEVPLPILVELGDRGPTLEGVKVEENELDAFLQKFQRRRQLKLIPTFRLTLCMSCTVS